MLERELKAVERKFEKEGWVERGKDWETRSWQKIEEALKNTLQQEITPQNQEKIAGKKEIIKWREEIEEAKKEKRLRTIKQRLKELSRENRSDY